MYISWKWTYETGADSLLVRLGPMSELVDIEHFLVFGYPCI